MVLSHMPYMHVGDACLMLWAVEMPKKKLCISCWAWPWPCQTYLCMEVDFDSHHGGDQNTDSISMAMLSCQVQNGPANPILDSHVCRRLDELVDDLQHTMCGNGA